MRAQAKALPTDIWERRTALDPTRSFIVQAPAGSGKTELLIQRYLVLLARVRQPESVLAITFTVKAAGEMRERVLAALTNAEPGDLATAVMERDREFAWNLLANPARLRIQTIDALCAGIARRMPWLARFGAMPRVTEQPEEMYADAARATLRLIEGGDRFADAAERLLLHLDNDFARAQSMLEDLLPRRDQWLRHLVGHHDTSELRTQLDSTLGTISDKPLNGLREMLPSPEWRDELWRVARFAGMNRGITVADDYDGWQLVRGLLLRQDGQWRDSADARLGFPAKAPEWKQRRTRLALQLRSASGFREALAEIDHAPPPRFTDRQWEMLEALLRLLPAAAAQLKIVFQEHGLVDFAEIAQAAARGLGAVRDPTALAFHLGEQYEHILVDEVQDTSAAQVELIERLTASWDGDDEHTLFLVGDPMQSIYRFRDADVGLFLRIRSQGIGALQPEPLSLAANFRSRPEIVHWVNTSFAAIFPEREDEASGAVRFSPSDAFRMLAGEDVVHVHPFFGTDSVPEAVRAVDLALEAASQGTVAILARARTHVPEIAAELKRRGIAYRAVEQDLLGERPVVRDLYALTRALLHLADRTAWLAILRAPWCGLDLAALHALASADPRGSIFDLASRSPDVPARFLKAMRVGLERVRRVPIRQCVETTWRALGGEDTIDDTAALSDAQRFLALIEEMDEGGEIANFSALDLRIETLFAQPDPAAGEQLQIMTIHKAKGLQFDTVIVPALGRESARDDKQLLLWTEVPGDTGRELVVAPVESAEDSDDPIYGYLRHLERSRARNEAMRLLYVAATRARERLHLLGQVAVKDEELVKPRGGSLLALLWPVVEPVFRAAYDAGAPVVEQAATVGGGVSIRRLPADWSSPATEASLDWNGAEASEPVIFDWVSDALRHSGTIVHAWLSRIVEEGVDNWTPARVAARSTAIETALEALGVSQLELRGAVLHVTDALVQTLGDVRGRWLLRRREVDACEYELAVPVDGVVQHAVIDRTFVEDGVRWIIDYKTSSHEGGDLETFLVKEVARYRDQLARYARMFQEFDNLPVRVALYFPLLGAWRDWEENSATGPLFALAD